MQESFPKNKVSLSPSQDLIESLDQIVNQENFASRSETVEQLLKVALQFQKVKRAIIVWHREHKIRDVPSILCSIDGKTVLEHLIWRLKHYGVEEILIAIPCFFRRDLWCCGNWPEF